MVAIPTTNKKKVIKPRKKKDEAQERLQLGPRTDALAFFDLQDGELLSDLSIPASALLWKEWDHQKQPIDQNAHALSPC